MFPVYIYIFNRVYDRLRVLDFICLCLPVIGWLYFAVALADSSGFGLLVTPGIPLSVSAVYFLVFPLSKRFPGVSRAMISLLLVGLIMIVLVILIHSASLSRAFIG